MKNIYLKLLTKTKYTLPHYTLTSSASKNSHYCFGTEEGSIIYFYNDTLEAQQISNYSIHNVTYLSNTLIACSSDDSTLYILDIIKNKITSLYKHLKSIRFVKSSGTLFYTCSRDKNVFEWDLRTLDVAKRLEHSGSVTCLDTNKCNENIFYTSSTPGTNIYTWDLRYTKLGKYYFINRFINNNYSNNLIFYDYNLYCRTKNSALFKISQTATLFEELCDFNFNGFCSSIIYNELYDCLFISNKNEIMYFKEDLKKYYAVLPLNMKDLRGLCCITDNTLIVYNDKNVVNYEIIPFINNET